MTTTIFYNSIFTTGSISLKQFKDLNKCHQANTNLEKNIYCKIKINCKKTDSATYEMSNLQLSITKSSSQHFILNAVYKESIYSKLLVKSEPTYPLQQKILMHIIHVLDHINPTSLFFLSEIQIVVKKNIMFRAKDNQRFIDRKELTDLMS